MRAIAGAGITAGINLRPSSIDTQPDSVAFVHHWMFVVAQPID